MQLNYKIEHRNIKYPRLEFKGTTLLVILPPNIKDPTKIIEKRKNWIQKKWQIIQRAIKSIDTNQSFMILGQPYSIQRADNETPMIDFQNKTIKINPENPKHQKIMKRKFKKILLQKINSFVEEYSQKLGEKPNKIWIRRQTTKWATCSNKRNLSFNLKLVCLPEKLIKYVVLHEMLHLKHKRHNIYFWQEIEREFPNYKEMEMKLLVYWFQTEILLKNLSINS